MILSLTLISLATTLGTFAGIIGAVGIIATKTPLRKVCSWLWKRNVSLPLTEWTTNNIREVVTPLLKPIYDELSYNSGSTTKDKLRQVTERLERIESMLTGE